MFKEFKPVSKEEWLEKVTKDLKGKKSIDSFNWELDGMEFTPFYHADDKNGGFPLINEKPNNSWEIGERIIVSDYKTANEQALAALQKGANALLFIFDKKPSLENLTILLKDIQHEWISTHFNIDIIEDYIKIIQSKNQNAAEINCSFPIDDILKIENYINELPLFSISVDTLNFNVSMVIKTGNDLLEKIYDTGLDVKKYHSKIQFNITIDDNYFASIAKIRALKICWAQILQAWGVSSTDCHISVHIVTLDEDEHYNKIKATTQAMSAVIGGADILYIYPSDAFKNPNGTTFSRRIALNVQHLMQQESYLDRVVDPGAGSYFIEELTNRIAEKAWSDFTKTL